ncbi:MAG TPA: hypothetical protein VKU01_12780 [Bryobacteraceae bacterium]|nr:hypothetical protein [Bryobacteraceae bacterium]
MSPHAPKLPKPVKKALADLILKAHAEALKKPLSQIAEQVDR